MSARVFNLLVRAEGSSLRLSPPFEKIRDDLPSTWVAEVPLKQVNGVENFASDLYATLKTMEKVLDQAIEQGGCLYLHIDFEGMPLRIEASLLALIVHWKMTLEIVPQ